MKSYEILPLKNKDIPKKVKDLLTEDLKNYIIMKDGHIITRKLDDSFNNVTIMSYEEALPDMIHVFLDTEYVNDNQDDAYEYNIENVNSGLLIHVPRNTYIENNLHVFYISEDIDLVQNTRIVLEENSELKYFEYLTNVNDASIKFVKNTILKENEKIQ